MSELVQTGTLTHVLMLSADPDADPRARFLAWYACCLLVLEVQDAPERPQNGREGDFKTRDTQASG